MSLQKRIRKNMERTAATETASKAAAKRKERRDAELRQRAKQLGPIAMHMRSLRGAAMLAGLEQARQSPTEPVG